LPFIFTRTTPPPDVASTSRVSISLCSFDCMRCRSFIIFSDVHPPSSDGQRLSGVVDAGTQRSDIHHLGSELRQQTADGGIIPGALRQLLQRFHDALLRRGLAAGTLAPDSSTRSDSGTPERLRGRSIRLERTFSVPP
jgi:hypothetical protein